MGTRILQESPPRLRWLTKSRYPSCLSSIVGFRSGMPDVSDSLGLRQANERERALAPVFAVVQRVARPRCGIASGWCSCRARQRLPGSSAAIVQCQSIAPVPASTMVIYCFATAVSCFSRAVAASKSARLVGSAVSASRVPCPNRRPPAVSSERRICSPVGAGGRGPSQTPTSTTATVNQKMW